MKRKAAEISQEINALPSCYKVSIFFHLPLFFNLRDISFNKQMLLIIHLFLLTKWNMIIIQTCLNHFIAHFLIYYVKKHMWILILFVYIGKNENYDWFSRNWGVIIASSWYLSARAVPWKFTNILWKISHVIFF